ncbi:MAG: type II toxin-antitoxin system RelE/ParE family toxin [Gammaproteobacteria bacterium]|nr:type II toxin-antitoxin system RelE/ParE family toxin [Gammaproteobacteria bacterium]
MPQLIVSPTAARGLEKCRQFLYGHNPVAAQRAAIEIQRHLSLLETDPKLGKLVEPMSPLRELIIPFSSSGYVALYHLLEVQNLVVIVAFRHQKEAGY